MYIFGVLHFLVFIHAIFSHQNKITMIMAIFTLDQYGLAGFHHVSS